MSRASHLAQTCNVRCYVSAKPCPCSLPRPQCSIHTTYSPYTHKWLYVNQYNEWPIVRPCFSTTSTWLAHSRLLSAFQSHALLPPVTSTNRKLMICIRPHHHYHIGDSDPRCNFLIWSSKSVSFCLSMSRAKTTSAFGADVMVHILINMYKVCKGLLIRDIIVNNITPKHTPTFI